MSCPVPLFVCHANCSRSVLAHCLYLHLTGSPALSAGLIPGSVPAPRAVALLRHWGITGAERHRATQLTRELCDQAGAIFTMGPLYTRRLLLDYGWDLAKKTFLFADPFTPPVEFRNGEYIVSDPGFDDRPLWQVAPDYAWFRERVLAIRLAMLGYGPRRLIPAEDYLGVLAQVEPL